MQEIFGLLWVGHLTLLFQVSMRQIHYGHSHAIGTYLMSNHTEKYCRGKKVFSLDKRIAYTCGDFVIFDKKYGVSKIFSH